VLRGLQRLAGRVENLPNRLAAGIVSGKILGMASREKNVAPDESPVRVAILAEIEAIEARRDELAIRIDQLRFLLEAYDQKFVASPAPVVTAKKLGVESFPELGPRKSKPNHIAKVRLYFQQRGNPWKTAEQVADDLGIPQASARDILGRSRKEEYEWKQAVPNEPKFFRLKNQEPK
jgi:hypothetical protein